MHRRFSVARWRTAKLTNAFSNSVHYPRLNYTVGMAYARHLAVVLKMREITADLCAGRADPGIKPIVQLQKRNHNERHRILRTRRDDGTGVLG